MQQQEEKTAPANSKFKTTVIAFMPLMLVFICMNLLLSVYEVIANTILHSSGSRFITALLFNMLGNLAFALSLTLPLLLLFVITFLLSPRLARFIFIAIATIIIVIHIALAQYFMSTLVPLGGDLWQYSSEDIRQTVGASGQFMKGMIVFIITITITVLAFIFGTHRLKLSWKPALAFLLLFVILGVSGALNAVGHLQQTGNEYERSLTANKSTFFYSGSYDHFFPHEADIDIYSDNYIGDYGSDVGTNSSVAFNYTDADTYPFLHSDETPDVLNPFFNSSPRKPDIVIILVEGLGRAFTNEGAALGNFTPFLDSLSGHSLYWENFLSEGGRTFAVLPSLLGSLPFGKAGFNEFDIMPAHVSLLSLLKHNGYSTSFFYGGDAHFDNMDVFLKNNFADRINDIKTLPAGYTQLPANSQGFTWGYGDKELYRRYFDATPDDTAKPACNVLLTVATHSPFFVNDQDAYLRKFEARIQQMGFDAAQQDAARNYKYQYASILYADDALRTFFNTYKQRASYSNTIFFITGDHRMPEIPMLSKLDRYHVPLIVFSPLLARNAKFSSISTHFDIAPSLLSFLKTRYDLQVPALASWIGSGLDTSRAFRNIHNYPLMQTKSDLNGFIMGNYMINDNELFRINNDMKLIPETNASTHDRLSGNLDIFKQRNNAVIQGKKLVPDSIYRQYTSH